MQTTISLFLLIIALGVVKCANVELDKATVNDVAANAVSPDKKAVNAKKEGGASVQITGITTGAETNDTYKPQRAGSMFARFIDDIFQIPITVLQNVAKLITNPFVQQKKTPEAAAVS